LPAPQANPGDGEAYLAAFTAAIEEVTAAQAALSDVELAIRFGAVTGSSDLVARRLVTQDRVICASPDYLRTHGEPQTLADVRAHRCIVGSLKGGGYSEHRPRHARRWSNLIGLAVMPRALDGCPAVDGWWRQRDCDWLGGGVRSSRAS
jgi:DNA-binding transcriptional LysR family regulator